MAAIRRRNLIDPALRHIDCFDREIDIGISNPADRLQILRIHTQNLRLGNDVKLDQISKETNRYVGADLASLCSETALQQIREKKYFINLKNSNSLVITQENFRFVLKQSNASALHAIGVEVRTTCKDIGCSTNCE